MGDEYLQSRLRHCKYDGANGARPKKLLMHMLKMAGSLEKGTVEECEAAYNLFVKDLALYEFSMGKIQVIADTNMREMDAYKQLQEKLAGDMKRLSGEIETLKERVAHERVVRKNKEEYAALAKQVNMPLFFLSRILIHSRMHTHEVMDFLLIVHAPVSSYFAMNKSHPVHAHTRTHTHTHTRTHAHALTQIWTYSFVVSREMASMFMN
jgi:hypothetical protein